MQLLDSISTAPLWIQAPIVVIPTVVVCGILAFFFLRIIDIAGAKLSRSFRRREGWRSNNEE